MTVRSPSPLLMSGTAIALLFAFPAFAQPTTAAPTDPEEGKIVAQSFQQKGPFGFSGSLKLQAQHLEDDDLGSVNSNISASRNVDTRLRITVKPLDSNFSAYWEGQAQKTWGQGSAEDDSGRTFSGQYFAWRQSWVQYDQLFDVIPLNIRVGRQRVREPSAIWWNNDLDMVKLTYDSTLFSGFLGVGENLNSYRSSHDDFLNSNRDRTRFLGEASWQYAPLQYFELRGFHENDHSGTEATGSLIKTNNRDTTDNKLSWFGARARGSQAFGENLLSGVEYSADIIGVRGTVDTLNSAATANPERRLVTGSTERDVRGWAVDTRANILVDSFFGQPAIVLGYAYGSGDDNAADGTDHAFRQTELQGTTSTLGLARTAYRHYGEVFAPELSNIHILTAGLSIPVFKQSDINFVYHKYRLADKQTGVRSSQINASVNGLDTDLGQEADIVLNIDLDAELNLPTDVVKGQDLKVSLGAFEKGDAYKSVANDEDTVYRGLVQVQFKF